MFGLARKEDLVQIEENVKRSFTAVREDSDHVYQWLNTLYADNQRLKAVLDEQTQTIAQLPKSKEEIRAIVDAHYSLEPVLERVRAIEHRVDLLGRSSQRIEQLEHQQQDVFSQLRALHSQVSEVGNLRRQNVIPNSPRMVPESATALQEKVIKLAIRNSKDVIKQSILKLIRLHGQIAGVALRESIVHEQGLCSKSSFYRLLEELEESSDITVIDEGKEKRYLWGGARAKKVKHD